MCGNSVAPKREMQGQYDPRHELKNQESGEVTKSDVDGDLLGAGRRPEKTAMEDSGTDILSKWFRMKCSPQDGTILWAR